MPFAATTPLTALMAALALVSLDTGLGVGFERGAARAADAGAARRRVATCLDDVRCRRPPGPPDRDIRPLIDPLGRPCGLRWRETPSGPRRVRVCY